MATPLLGLSTLFLQAVTVLKRPFTATGTPKNFNMVAINLAYTAPINPAGATPVLSEDQIWAGLKRKVRHAQEFVPVIVACEVLSEEGNTVVRQATFKAEDNNKETNDPVKEVCVHLPPSRVDFKQEDESTISNIVSKGPEGDLFMTYSFEWRHPKVEEGSSEEKELKAKYEKVSDVVVCSWQRRLIKMSDG